MRECPQCGKDTFRIVKTDSCVNEDGYHLKIYRKWRCDPKLGGCGYETASIECIDQINPAALMQPLDI